MSRRSAAKAVPVLKCNRKSILAIAITAIVWLGSRQIQLFYIQTQTNDAIPTTFDIAAAQNQSLPVHDDPHNEPVEICGITAMFGDYEKTAKEPTEPLSPLFKLFLITDQEHLLHPNSTTAWTRVRVNSSLWQEDCKKEEFVGARNNPCEQPFLFNLAKFYKMQFYRVPQLQEAGCNVVIWLDATIQIKTGGFMGRMADRASRKQNFVVFVQDGPRRGWQNGEVKSEVGRSKFGKYGGKQPGSFGPPQKVGEQYEYYLSQGYREKWFQNETWFNEYRGVSGNVMKYGLYITCMVMFDLRQEETKQFLECWWRENILRSTQDQVGFPYCAWKLKTRIHALPDSEEPTRWDPWDQNADTNPYFRKLGHGL